MGAGAGSVVLVVPMSVWMVFFVGVAAALVPSLMFIILWNAPVEDDEYKKDLTRRSQYDDGEEQQ